MPISDWTILVVEDTADDVNVISKILTFHGAKVIVAHNGVDCIEKLENLTPTVIITDLAMPEMDGWSTLEWIKSNPRTQHIPVIAVTAFHSSDMDVDVHTAGFDAYLPKPLRPNTLIDLISDIVTL